MPVNQKETNANQGNPKQQEQPSRIKQNTEFEKQSNAPLVKESAIDSVNIVSHGQEYKIFLSDGFYERINKYNNETKLAKLKQALEGIV